jgi:hypothetical protein
MNHGPSWVTFSGFLFTATENVEATGAVLAEGAGTTYKIISGKLPSGMVMSINGGFSGILSPVQSVARNQFVVRAENTSGATDRTFIIDVVGITPPTWDTTNVTIANSSTYLQVGPEHEPYALNTQYVSFQLRSGADPALTPVNTTFTYYLGNNSGNLPPGLTLSKDGVIYGIVDDVLEIDTVTGIGIPKIYTFTVTVTDGVASSSKEFKILVVNPDIIQDPSAFEGLVEPGILVTNTNYIPPLQFINGTELGVIRASNNIYLDVSAYDPYPDIEHSVYTLVTGTSITTHLPPDLSLDQSTGIIYGYVPYQSAYTKNYQLTIAATRVVTTTSMVTATNTFTLAVKGHVDSSMEWISSSSLGSITIGEISELRIQARQTNNDYAINYQILSGSIPSGLTLQRDGTISGIIDYSENTGTYTFTIQANDIYEFNEIERTFNLDVIRYNDKKYTQVYCRPFLTRAKRQEYQEFMLDNFVFDPSLIYRYFDPNFGVQSEIKMVLEFGLEQLNIDDIVPALHENFYRRRFQFGDVKIATANDNTGTKVYEIVYVEVVDNLVNNNGVSVSKVVNMSNEFFYPASVDNMRSQLSQLTLPDFTTVDTNEYLMPKYMRSQQTGDYKNIGYIRVIPLCYALPGQGSKIVSRIKSSGFDFKQLDFEVDRIIVQDSLDNSTAKYLLLERQAVGNLLDRDAILVWPTGFELPLPDNKSVTRD